MEVPGHSSRPRDVATLAALVAAAFAAYLLMNHLLINALVAEFPSRGMLKSIVYLSWIACGFATLLAVLLAARGPVLYLLSAVVFVSVSINYVYARLLSRVMTPENTEWLLSEFQRVPSAWGEFRPDVLAAAAEALAYLSVFLLLRALLLRHAFVRGSWITRPSGHAAAWIAFAGFHGAITVIQPSYAAAETNIVVFGLPVAFSSQPKHRDVPASVQAQPRVDKIVLVVDESVNHEIYTSVILPGLRDRPVIDFGTAASSATCSAASNALLRWGVLRSRAGDPGYDPRANPTIWSFAKKAGFRTTLIDGQSNGLAHNFLGMNELSRIDEFIPAAAGVNTDRRIAAMLNERLARPGRELIYVIMRGSHFPYEQNYPDNRVSRNASPVHKYLASVHYSTGGFFEALGKDLPLASLLFVYTSDHGQNVGARVPHCSSEELTSEYSVPLLVLSEAPALEPLLRSGISSMLGRASHLNIFPTLLYGLGYEREWIEAAYGPTLAGPPGLYVRVGKLPYPRGRDHPARYATSLLYPGRAAR